MMKIHIDVFIICSMLSAWEVCSTSTANSTNVTSTVTPAIFGAQSAVSSTTASTSSQPLVAFSVARRSNYQTSPSYATPVPFDEIFLSYGGGFDRYSSHFVAPVTGIYCFMASIYSYSGTATVSLMYNNNRRISMRDTTNGMAANQVILYLSAGSHVWLQMEAGSGAVYSSSTYKYTTFSGYLIKY